MSNKLFAPQVEVVQPAFIKTVGTVDIYYTLSDFSDITATINYKVIDPNVQSGWGANIIKSEENISARLEDENSKKYKFSIDFGQRNSLIANQYYHVQIQLVSGTKTSDWSQVTLIRPIPAISNIVIEQLEGGEIEELDEITGSITYADGSVVEQIQEISFDILKNGKTIASSAIIKNFLGTHFRIPANNIILNNGNYTLLLKLKTINGFYKEKSFDFSFGINTSNYRENIVCSYSTKIQNEENDGSIFFNITFENINGNTMPNSSGLLKIQRASADYEFLNWKTLTKAKIKFAAPYIYWKDFSAEGGQVYQYRFIFEDDNETDKYLITKKIAKKNPTQLDLIEVTANFEGLFLSNKSLQLAIKFNPSITNFKFVTQESITNALGGRFPVIRSIGETYYRQFTIGGTISFLMETYVDNENSYDSVGENMNNWLSEDMHSLFFNIDDAFKKLSSNECLPYKRNASVIEKKFRDIAMSFLTDKTPKLFRSITEGNIIVYLTNVSFTPNKTLGRNIYDFSATATEVCEATYENMQKYHLNIPNDFTTYVYVLKIQETPKIEGVYLIPYISGGSVINGKPALELKNASALNL